MLVVETWIGTVESRPSIATTGSGTEESWNLRLAVLVSDINRPVHPGAAKAPAKGIEVDHPELFA